jgi:hypothetical protein
LLQVLNKEIGQIYLKCTIINLNLTDLIFLDDGTIIKIRLGFDEPVKNNTKLDLTRDRHE